MLSLSTPFLDLEYFNAEAFGFFSAPTTFNHTLAGVGFIRVACTIDPEEADFISLFDSSRQGFRSVVGFAIFFSTTEPETSLLGIEEAEVVVAVGGRGGNS